MRNTTLTDFDIAKELVQSTPLSVDEFRVQMSQAISKQGVDLRKSKSYSEAVQCYNSALEISPNDDHLYFNLARVQYDMEDLSGCRMSLQKALDLNPDLYVASRFLNYLDGFI